MFKNIFLFFIFALLCVNFTQAYGVQRVSGQSLLNLQEYVYIQKQALMKDFEKIYNQYLILLHKKGLNFYVTRAGENLWDVVVSDFNEWSTRSVMVFDSTQWNLPWAFDWEMLPQEARAEKVLEYGTTILRQCQQVLYAAQLEGILPEDTILVPHFILLHTVFSHIWREYHKEYKNLLPWDFASPSVILNHFFSPFVVYFRPSIFKGNNGFSNLFYNVNNC